MPPLFSALSSSRAVSASLEPRRSCLTLLPRLPAQAFEACDAAKRVYEPFRVMVAEHAAVDTEQAPPRFPAP